MAKLNINGRIRDVQVEADTPLLWVIREQVGLTGTKYGCGVAQCGACSVHINGEVVRSCSIPVGERQGHRQDRHHRGPVGHQLASRAEGLGGARRAAVRLLPVGADHGGGGAAEEEAEADRRGHRRGDDQHLPLRHLSAHPRGGAHGGRHRRRPDMKRPSSDVPNLSRRKFIVGSAAAGGGLGSAFAFPSGSDAAEAQGAADAGTEVNAWVVVRPDDTCVIRIARSEMGQGTLTGLAQLVAEELECDWKKVDHRVDHAGPEPRPQARLGRDGHRRQPRHPHLAGLRPPRRRGRAHDAAAGGGRPVEGAGRRAHRGRRRHHARGLQAHDHLRQGRRRRGQADAARSRRASSSRIRRTGRSPASR